MNRLFLSSKISLVLLFVGSEAAVAQSQLPLFNWSNRKSFVQTGPAESQVQYQAGRFVFTVTEGVWNRQAVPEGDELMQADTTEIYPEPGRLWRTTGTPVSSQILRVEDDQVPGVDGLLTNDVAPYLRGFRPFANGVDTEDVLRGALTRDRPSGAGKGNIGFDDESFRFRRGDDGPVIQFASYGLDLSYTNENTQNQDLPGGFYEINIPVQTRVAPVGTSILNNVFRGRPRLTMADAPAGRWADDGVYEFDYRRSTELTWSNFLSESTSLSPTSDPNLDQTRLSVFYDDTSTDRRFDYVPPGSQLSTFVVSSQSIEAPLTEAINNGVGNRVVLPNAGNLEISSQSGPLATREVVVLETNLVTFTTTSLGVADGIISPGQSIRYSAQTAFVPVEFLVFGLAEGESIALSGTDAITGEAVSFDLITSEDLIQADPDIEATVAGFIELDTIVESAGLTDIEVRAVGGNGVGIIVFEFDERSAGGLRLPNSRQTSYTLPPNQLGLAGTTSIVGENLNCEIEFTRFNTSDNEFSSVRGEALNVLNFQIRPVEGYSGWALSDEGFGDIEGITVGGPGTTATGDFDQDGIVNLVEFALSSDPATPNGSVFPLPQRDPETGRISLEVTKRPGVGQSLSYIIEYSRDLVSWVQLVDGDKNFEILQDDSESLEIRSLEAVPEADEIYFRLRVIQNF